MSSEDEIESLNIRPWSGLNTPLPGFHDLPWDNPTRIIHSFFKYSSMGNLKNDFLYTLVVFLQPNMQRCRFFIGKLKLGTSWRHHHVVVFLLISADQVRSVRLKIIFFYVWT